MYKPIIKTIGKINVKVQGVRGNKPKYDENKGCVTVFIEDNNRKETGIILIDAFKGEGRTYQKLENNRIAIYSDYALLVFQGTFEELLNKLK